MENGFERDETQETDFRGDGCYNCMNNPRYQTSRKKMGKPTIDPEVFDDELSKFLAAYDSEIEVATHDIYWEHLAYTFKDNEEFKETMFIAIDTYPQFPAISEILEVVKNLRSYST